MFFWTRSVLCVGLVALAASRVGAGDVATAVDRGARQAADEAGQACLRSDACLRIGAAALGVAAAPALPLRVPTSPPRRAARRPDPRAGRAEPGSGA